MISNYHKIKGPLPNEGLTYFFSKVQQIKFETYSQITLIKKLIYHCNENDVLLS